LEKQNHYLFESPNVKPIIDPLIHEMIIKMVNSESRGRKSKSLLKPPLFCICKTCGNYLLEKDNWLVCENCGKEHDCSSIVSSIVNQTKKLIERNVHCRTNRLKEILLKQYELRLDQLLRRERELMVNKEHIENQELFNQKNKQRLLIVNKNECCNNQKELRLVEHMIQMLKEMNKVNSLTFE
jgi:hypothetical protein